VLSASKATRPRSPYFLKAPEALGHAFPLAVGRPSSLLRVSGPPFPSVSARFFDDRCDLAAKRFCKGFFIDFSNFFGRRRHSFSIAPLVDFGDRAAMSDFAKHLQNTGHAQKNRCRA
jgi:hypothetical protein